MPNELLMHMIHFGETLKAMRTDAGMTQKAAAKKLGISVSTLRRVERGESVNALGDLLVRWRSEK